MEIETNVPMPTAMDGKPRRSWPFKDMNVGESVFFADEPSGSSSRPVVAAYVLAHNRREAGQSSRFKAQSIDGGVRIWRSE